MFGGGFTVTGNFAETTPTVTTYTETKTTTTVTSVNELPVVPIKPVKGTPTETVNCVQAMRHLLQKHLQKHKLTVKR